MPDPRDGEPADPAQRTNLPPVAWWLTLLAGIPPAALTRDGTGAVGFVLRYLFIELTLVFVVTLCFAISLRRRAR